MADLREALGAAIDAHSDDTPSAEPATSPEPASPSPSTEPSSEPTQQLDLPLDSAPKTEKIRDALGRFVPAAKEATPQAAAAKPAEQQPAPPIPDATQIDPALAKAPVGWTVTAKQEWDKLSPAVRAEVHRREKETAQALSQSTQARAVVSRLQTTVQPYLHAIQAETKGDVFAAINGLMNTATQLRFGTPSEKAGIIAHLVNAYAVDISMLDNALVGAPQPQNGFDPSMIQNAVQQALSPLLQGAQQRREQQMAQTQQTVQTEISAFAADPKNKYFEDVRDLMADVMEVNEKRGLQISLEQAYNTACRLHPEVAKILDAQSTATSVANVNAAAQRSKSAAVSVAGSAPVGRPDGEEPSTVRAAIEAAIDAHTRV